jgi:hypothetical protein
MLSEPRLPRGEERHLSDAAPNLANQAKRMAGRVEVDAEAAVAGWLMIVTFRAQGQYAGFGCVYVTDRKVKMELLRVGPTRPCRGNPVINLLKRESGRTIKVVGRNSSAWRLERHPVTIPAFLDRPPKQARVELPEQLRIRAVEDDEVQDRLVHGEIRHHTNVALTKPAGPRRQKAGYRLAAGR